jgi:hypothetical protein
MSKSNSLHFFATRRDLEGVLQAIESYHPVVYVKAGISRLPEVQRVSSGLDIPGLGVATAGDQNQQQWYLVTEPRVEVEIESIPQRRGGMRFAIDQQKNPHSIAFRPGGVFKGKCIIPGQVGSCSENIASKELLNLFVKEFRRQFTRIKSYYVGEEAAQLLDSGFRLTFNARSPVEHDLVR